MYIIKPSEIKFSTFSIVFRDTCTTLLINYNRYENIDKCVQRVSDGKVAGTSSKLWRNISKGKSGYLSNQWRNDRNSWFLPIIGYCAVTALLTPLYHLYIWNRLNIGGMVVNIIHAVKGS